MTTAVSPGPARTTSGAPLPLVALPQGELLTVNIDQIPLLKDLVAPGRPHPAAAPGPREGRVGLPGHPGARLRAAAALPHRYRPRCGRSRAAGSTASTPASPRRRAPTCTSPAARCTRSSAPADNTEDTIALAWIEGAQVSFNEDGTLPLDLRRGHRPVPRRGRGGRAGRRPGPLHPRRRQRRQQRLSERFRSSAGGRTPQGNFGSTAIEEEEQPCTAFDGVRVLELGQIYNGPYCGLLFAQLGADVIKIEPPGGEPLRFRSHEPVESHEFVMLNSNKRSVVLDLKTDAGRQALLDLVETADVLIENFAPGTMERLQLGPARLLAHNPRLVVASGKGYGSTGPYAHMSAMDITVQAMSGAASATGEPDGPPTKAGAAFVDFSGGIHLFAAISAALFQRERTGRGQIVEVSMHDTIYPMLASSLGGLHNNPERQLPERTGNRHSGMAVAPYNIYPAERRLAGDHLHRPSGTGAAWPPRWAGPS